jgi:hypothetical protein
LFSVLATSSGLFSERRICRLFSKEASARSYSPDLDSAIPSEFSLLQIVRGWFLRHRHQPNEQKPKT